MPAIEDMEPAGEPKPLPVFADEPGAPGVTAPEAAWLQHRPKVGMQSLESWLITVAVIAVIFCAAGVGLLGLDHSLELANAAMTQASATGAVLRTLIVH